MKRLVQYVWGTVSMFIGSSLVFGSLVWMNESGRVIEEKPEVRQVSFEVQKRIEPPKKKQVEKKPKRDEVPKWKPPAVLDGLNSQLAGVDLGLPSLDLHQVVGQNDSLLGAVNDLVMTGDAVDVPPRATRRVSVGYPRRAKSKGIEGYVALNLLITPSGGVEKVKVLESIPPDVFDQVAIAAVKQWQFEPGMHQGKRVRVWAKQTIRFDLS